MTSPNALAPLLRTSGGMPQRYMGGPVQPQFPQPNLPPQGPAATPMQAQPGLPPTFQGGPVQQGDPRGFGGPMPYQPVGPPQFGGGPVQAQPNGNYLAQLLQARQGMGPQQGMMSTQ